MFVTNENPVDPKNPHHEYDEVWQGPVWTVDVVRQYRKWVAIGGVGNVDSAASDGAVTAVVCNWETPWIMTAYQNWQPYKLEVGDLVRVGDLGTNGSDYLTVIDRVEIEQIANGITGTGGSGIYWSAGKGTEFDDVPLPQPANAGDAWSRNSLPETGPGSSTLQVRPLSDAIVFSAAARAKTYYAYRLNHSINATTPPVTMERRGEAASDAQTLALLQERPMIEINQFYAENTGKLADTANNNWPEEQDTTLRTSGTPKTEVLAIPITMESWMKRRLFPLFKVKAPPLQHKVTLDRGVKAVHWIKLYAATFVNKRQVGLRNAHEMVVDDWAALHIKEVQGEVISNNLTANGAFAVLHAGHSNDAVTGAVEVREQEVAGLATVIFERPRTDMRSLTIELRDRLGRNAHLGRIHLWFKLCVSHG